MSQQQSFEEIIIQTTSLIKQDSSPAINLLLPTPNPLSYLHVKLSKLSDHDSNEEINNNNQIPQTMLASSFVGSKIINKTPIHPLLQEILHVDTLNYDALLHFNSSILYYISIIDQQLAQLQSQNSNQLQHLIITNNDLADQIYSLSKNIILQSPQKLTTLQKEEIEFTSKKQQVLYSSPQQVRYEIDLRKEMIQLEKENIDLRMVIDDQLMEINYLKKEIDHYKLELTKPTKPIYIESQPQHPFIPPPNYEKDALIHQIRQYQERIIQVDQSHSNKQVELSYAIEGLVDENSILIKKYNMIVDQLRAMKLINDDLNQELQLLQDQKISTDTTYDELRISYAKLKSKFQDMQVQYEEELQLRLNSISELEETLASTRDQLFQQQNNIQQLQQQLQSLLIQQQQNLPTQKVYNTDDVNRLKERLYQLEQEKEQLKRLHQQDVDMKDQGMNEAQQKISKLEGKLEAEKYLVKQLETKINQFEKQILELQFEKERLVMRISDYEQKFININEYKLESPNAQQNNNSKQVYENKIMFLEQQLSGYKDQLQRSENKRRDMEQKIQRLTKEVDDCKDKIKAQQKNHLNDINQLKLQLQNYYLKSDERYEVEQKLNLQKTRLEEMAMNLNRQMIEKDKNISLMQIEKQQLQEQLKEKGIDLDRAKGKYLECEMLKQQLQNYISQLEQSKLRELEQDLQRRIYELDNQNQEYSVKISTRKQVFIEDI